VGAVVEPTANLGVYTQETRVADVQRAIQGESQLVDDPS
jgi:hypothetical protein